MDIPKNEREHIKILHRNNAFSFVDENNAFYPYTSAMIGPYKINSGAVTNNGFDYKKAVNDLSSMILGVIGSHSDAIISGGESRDWVFSYPVANQLCLPHFAMYKNGKVFGPELNGKDVFHIADLNNEGSSPRDLWVPKIRSLGGNINHIFFYVDRDEKGVDVMKKMGLSSHSLVKLENDRWMFMRAQGLIDDDEYSAVMKYRANPGEWANSVLGSEKGMAQLLDMKNGNEENKKKAEKITDFYDLRKS